MALNNIVSMQLKKILARTSERDGKKFFRFDITIHPGIIEDLGWKDKEKLKATIKGGKLVIEKD